MQFMGEKNQKKEENVFKRCYLTIWIFQRTQWLCTPVILFSSFFIYQINFLLVHFKGIFLNGFLQFLNLIECLASACTLSNSNLYIFHLHFYKFLYTTVVSKNWCEFFCFLSSYAYKNLVEIVTHACRLFIKNGHLFKKK